MCTTKYGFVETFSPFEQIKRWKTKYFLSGTMVLVSQVVTYSCVSMFHFHCGPTVALQFLPSPTCQHRQKYKKLASTHLGTSFQWHFTATFVPHSNKVPTQVFNTFAVRVIKPSGKIQSLFISFNQSRPRSPEFLRTVRQGGTRKKGHCWRGGDMMERFVDTAVKLSLTCCQHRPLAMTS